MRKHNLPLVQLTAVVPVFFFRIRPRPDVLAVAAVDVVRNKINAVHILARKVIQGPNHAFAFYFFPRRVTGFPVVHMWLVPMQKFCSRRLSFALQLCRIVCPIEVGVSEKVLRAVGSAFEKILTRFGKSQVSFSDVFKESFTSQVSSLFISRADCKRSICDEKGDGFSCFWIAVESDIRPGTQRCLKRPFALFIGNKMYAPFIA